MLSWFRATDGRPFKTFLSKMSPENWAMFYAYILESSSVPREFYRGHTVDLKQRLADHNSGKCLHSSKFGPWKVKFYAAFETQQLAQSFEKYLITTGTAPNELSRCPHKRMI